jgi:hypothetical protein
MSIIFKYIKLSQKENYWSFPLENGSLYFPSIPELREVNDETEFDHSWDVKSLYFKATDFKQMKKSYDNLFSNTRVLCLSKSFSQKIWDEFIKGGEGICYEFELLNKNHEITSGDVIYDDNKVTNIEEFILNSPLTSIDIKNILLKTELLNESEIKLIRSWRDWDLKRNLLNHILNEIVFKKETKYSLEDEYRFVHMCESYDKVPIKYKLEKSAMKFEDIGLTLKCVHTNMIDKVKNIQINSKLRNVEIRSLSF